MPAAAASMGPARCTIGICRLGCFATCVRYAGAPTVTARVPEIVSIMAVFPNCIALWKVQVAGPPRAWQAEALALFDAISSTQPGFPPGTTRNRISSVQVRKEI